MNIEREFLHYVLTSLPAINEVTIRRIDESFVSDETLSRLFGLVLQYHRKYNKLLSNGALLRILDKIKGLKEEQCKNILVLRDELSELEPTCPFEFVVDELVEEEKNRRITKILIQAVDVSESQDSERSIDVLKKGLLSVESLGSSDVRGGKLSDSVEQRKRRYKEVQDNPDAGLGILTPFKTFNELTGGLQDGDLMLVISATSEGKSTFLLNLAYHAYAVQQKNVVYVQIEMTREATEGRLDALDANLRARDIWLANLKPEEKDHYFKVLDKQKKRRGIFYTCDIPSNCTTDVIKAELETLRMQFDIDLIIVDYFDIMTESYIERVGSSGWESRKKMAQNLKGIARDFDVPICTAAQVDSEGMRSTEESYKIHNVALTKYLPAQTDITLSLKSINTDITTASGVAKLMVTFIKNRNNAKGSFPIIAELSKFRMEQDTRPMLRIQA